MPPTAQAPTHEAAARPAAEAPPRPPMDNALGKVLGAVYAKAVAVRNSWYDVNHGRRVDRPVVSVGNISAGGTGKTPMVIQLVQWLKEAGRVPCIALRGYKSPSGNPAESDEALQYTRALPGLMLAVGKDRLWELKQMFTTRRGMVCDSVVLDDGFQHRRLWRDLDIVLIDAMRPPFGDRLLPAGWLREPVTALKRASAVVLTHAEAVSAQTVHDLNAKVAAAHGKPALAVCGHVWSALVSGEGQNERTVPASWIAGRRVAVSCAIGNSAAFVKQVKRQAEVAGELILKDHDPYAPATVAKLAAMAKDSKADVILVTEKDWSKLRLIPAEKWPCPMLRPRLALQFASGERELHDLVIATVRAFKPHKGPRKES